MLVHAGDTEVLPFLEELITLSFDDGLLVSLLDNRVDENFLDDWLLEDLMHDFLSLLNICSMLVLFSHNWNMFLLNQGRMLFMNNRLMVLMNVFLIDNGLVVLMDHILMMFMKNIFLVLHNHIFVMLMNHILMNLFDDCRLGVALEDGLFLSGESFLALVERFHYSLLLMSNVDWFLNDFLHDGLSSESLLERHVLMTTHHVLALT